MNDHHKPDGFNDLVEAATDSVRQQEERAAVLAAKRPRQPKGKKIFTLMLLTVLAGLFIHQYPRIAQPYALPDPTSDSTVVVAELEVIAELIESYRLSQGKYPAALTDVRLPAGLAELVENSNLAYQVKEPAFALDWTLPHWHVVRDGGTGKIDVTPADGAR